MAVATWLVDGNEDVTLAEANGLLLNVRFTQDCGFRLVVFEGDNKVVFDKVKEAEKGDRSYFGFVIKKIQSLSYNFKHVYI
jgi:hypothetical protein